MQTLIEKTKAAIIAESYEDRAGSLVISVKSALDIVDRLAAEQEEKVERCFRCVNKFKIPVYDEDERVTDKYGAVEKGSIWAVSAHRGEQPVRLLLRSGNSDFSYIDISVETFKGYFEEVAAEQPKKDNGWILCSERLPEIAGYEVLATLENAIGQRRVTVIFTGYGVNPPWHCNHKEFDLSVWKVIAWQPLPAPLKEVH